MKKRILSLIMIFFLLFACIPMNASAAKVSKAQKKVANKVDYFVWMVLLETQWKVNKAYNYKSYVSKKQFLKQLKKVYNGKLNSRHKTVIAASQVNILNWITSDELCPADLGSMSSSKVKKEYTKLFGTKKPSINLPTLKSVTDLDRYYLMCGKKGNKVYRYSTETEDDYSDSFVGVKKNGSTYTVTKKYKYYSHWGIKARGEKPTQIITVKIKLKKKPSSSYGYNIIGITFS